MIRYFLSLVSFIILILEAMPHIEVYHKTCIVKSLNKCCQLNCTIFNKPESLSSLDYYFSTNMKIVNAYGNILITAKRQNKKPFKFLTSPQWNLCVLAEGAATIPLANAFYGDVIRHGKMPRRCPIEAGFYYVEGFVVSSNVFPAYTRNWTFQVRMTIFNIDTDGKQRNLASVQYSAEIRSRGGIVLKAISTPVTQTL